MRKKTLNLIYYGEDEYDSSKFEPISDRPFLNKPGGGLWTSPVDSEYGWKEWTSDNDYHLAALSVELTFKGTVLRINSRKDMYKLPWIEQQTMHFIAFQPMCIPVFYYDAIHLTVKGEQETRFSHPKSLYGWDCETVFVMNPNSIFAA